MRNPCKLTSLDDWLAEGEPDIRPSQFVIQSLYAHEDWRDNWQYSSPQEAFEYKKMLDVRRPDIPHRVIRRVVYEWVIE